MATFTRVLSVAFLGSLLAVGCVISSDDDGGIFGNDDAGTGDGDITGDGDPIIGDGDPDVDGSVIGDGDPDVDGSVIGDGDPDVDGGNEPQCFAPDQGDGGESCAVCLWQNCSVEWCACEADESCGFPGDEFLCMNDCLLESSTNGETADDAFATCGEGCAISADFLLADATIDLIACLRAGVTDPSTVGADGGGLEVAMCGDICFGYDEPATE